MSWIEVESKIKIKNPRIARREIKKIAKYVKTERKVDNYYSLEHGAYPKKSLRIRKRGEIAEVNFKQWGDYKKGVWAKEEVEFRVSDIKNFFELLDNFGFKKWLTKEKRTELYRTKDGVNLELNFVKGLGWYVEIEILSNEENVGQSRKRIQEIINLLEPSGGKIEKRGYTRELWDCKK